MKQRQLLRTILATKVLMLLLPVGCLILALYDRQGISLTIPRSTR